MRESTPPGQPLDWEVMVMNADGTGVTQLTDTEGEFDGDPHWSPDGRKIVFTRQGGIAVMNADGTGVTQLTTGPQGAAGSDGEPAWSPDGRRIAFIRSAFPPCPAAGYRSELGSGPASQASNPPARAATGCQPAQDELWVMRADGSDQTRYVTGSPNKATPDWSPDGGKIVFSEDGIVVINADGSGLTRLRDDGGGAAWSPDGRELNCVAVRDRRRWRWAEKGGGPRARRRIGPAGLAAARVADRLGSCQAPPEGHYRAAKGCAGRSELCRRVQHQRSAAAGARTRKGARDAGARRAGFGEAAEGRRHESRGEALGQGEAAAVARPCGQAHAAHRRDRRERQAGQRQPKRHARAVNVADDAAPPTAPGASGACDLVGCGRCVEPPQASGGRC
jgi:hypothetical protein